MLITNANLITWGENNQILLNHAIKIDGDVISEIGPSLALEQKYSTDDKLDARGQYAMPGNICAHTHFYGAFARGMAIPGAPCKDFPEILERLWWKLDKALTMDDVRYSALVCLVDAVKHGTTTLIDHHASPFALEGSLDTIAMAVTQSGLRACMCYEVSDRDGIGIMRAGIDENVRFIKRMNAEHAHNQARHLAATFGLHASLSLSEKSLDQCRAALPEGSGFHIHVAEHEADEYDSLNQYGMRTVYRLHKHGILGAKSIAAHCVNVDMHEASVLRDTGTWVTHQPRSNMNNAVGAADIEGLLRMGIHVCLGNDGFSNAMWEEWKMVYLYHKAVHRDPRRADGYTVTQMAVDNNAKLAGMFFPQAKIGVLANGAFADIILVDYHPTTPLTTGNLPWHILFGWEPSAVTMTMAGGKVLMKDRKLLFLDEAEITAKSRELAEKCWKRYAS
jgi:putative selenium metabolism protein SsnA